MRTRAKEKYVAGDRARRENVPGHILYFNPQQKNVTIKITTNRMIFENKFEYERK